MIGDIAVGRAKGFISKLGDERLSVVRVDASNVNELASIMKDFDVIACALPFNYGMHACLKGVF